MELRLVTSYKASETLLGIETEKLADPEGEDNATKPLKPFQGLKQAQMDAPQVQDATKPLKPFQGLKQYRLIP